MLRWVVAVTTVGVALSCATFAGAWTQRDTAAVQLTPGPLETGFVDTAAFQGVNAPTALARLKGAGATSVLLVMYWYAIAPYETRPARFDATNPADPAYHWASFDRAVRDAAAAGVTPVAMIYGAPLWAQQPGAGRATTVRPDPTALAQFAQAAATRYSGRYGGLPRVQRWQVWNEPNLSYFLSPQFENGVAVSPAWYRAMVNAAATAIHGVDASNLVIAGGTFPFGGPGSDVYPLQFMREMLCMSAAADPQPTCSDRAQFDVWSHHPYTQGGPMHHAFNADSVSIADLPKMRRLLENAVHAGHIVTRRPLQFWVTEFSWESKPPDPEGVPAPLQARWVAEGLYRMWQAGVSLVTWFLLRDEQLPTSSFQSGLYYYDGPNALYNKPKPALAAFRFPFVAFRSGARVFVWGRTPAGRRGSVIVERSAKGRSWKRVAVLQANRYGIFTGRVVGPQTGSYRARLVAGGPAAVPFSMKVPADITLTSVFGK